ncbi:unnamed protein product [Heterobilharzia americana]|nr:unnamed protein product [Heterobilharzia americana]
MSEVEEIFKRLLAHKGVIGAIIVSSDGIAIRTSMDNSTTNHYCALIQQLIAKSRSAVRDLDPSNDLTFLRIRSTRNEIMVAPVIFPYLVIMQISTYDMRYITVQQVMYLLCNTVIFCIHDKVSEETVTYSPMTTADFVVSSYFTSDRDYSLIVVQETGSE